MLSMCWMRGWWVTCFGDVFEFLGVFQILYECDNYSCTIQKTIPVESQGDFSGEFQGPKAMQLGQGYGNSARDKSPGEF